MTQTMNWQNISCLKSIAALDLLKKNGEDAKVVQYLKNPPSTNEIKTVLREYSIIFNSYCITEIN